MVCSDPSARFPVCSRCLRAQDDCEISDSACLFILGLGRISFEPNKYEILGYNIYIYNLCIYLCNLCILYTYYILAEVFVAE